MVHILLNVVNSGCQWLMAFERRETIGPSAGQVLPAGQDAVVALDEKSTALPLPKERSGAAELGRYPRISSW